MGIRTIQIRRNLHISRQAVKVIAYTLTVLSLPTAIDVYYMYTNTPFSEIGDYFWPLQPLGLSVLAIWNQKDALSVQMDKLAQCEQQACSSATQRIEQSIETGQDTFGAYTAYSDCMNPCLAQRVRVQASSESSEE
ncbi:hypothetical protein T11_14556 [Trichinella zimbabwensis]|uniref:Uncharacterized protein n=1 Tax=Trichinella zimbabwensis TaxID=268475 RepID=A0A0V1I804_9BILA|nr:hypothetical protein T11_14556 [Trichinella zimbabwensis]